MHPVFYISVAIRPMGFGKYFTNCIAELLDTGNMQAAYYTSNGLNYIPQRIKRCNQSTSLDYMKEIRVYLAFQRLNDIAAATVFNQLSPGEKRGLTYTADHLHLQHYQDEHFFHPVFEQTHYLTETYINRVCRSIQLTSHRYPSESYSIYKLMSTAKTQLENTCSDMISTYLWTVYIFNCRMRCCTTVNHVTALLLSIIWNWIARSNEPIPTKESSLNLITYKSNIQTVNTTTFITPFLDTFLCVK